MNHVVLVGRIDSIRGERHLEDQQRANVVIKVNRPFKNEQGEYEVDYFNVMLYGSICDNTMEYCEPNDVIGIKGRLAQLENEEYPTIIAEKVTFLSSRKEKENDTRTNNGKE